CLFGLSMACSSIVIAEDRPLPDYGLCKKAHGDGTLILSGNVRVSLIGIDKPLPTEESLIFLNNLVQNKDVWLEYDPNNKIVNHRNNHEHLLAYVYLEDGTFVNKTLIWHGYGIVDTRYPFKFSKKFLRLERHAQKDKSGIWSDPGKIPFVASKTDRIVHLPTCPRARNIRINQKIIIKSRAEADTMGYSPCTNCAPYRE
ncbi:MAG: thermonuclease family protein, partial [Candidatus Theseobacter exili]|nr:thermonuclease family protein [Candidatus Theseobacter exili]